MSIEPAARSATRHVVNWRSGILLGACVAGGLTLDMMVLASTPDASIEAVAADAGIGTAPPDALAPIDTEVPAPAATSVPAPAPAAPELTTPAATSAPAPIETLSPALVSATPAAAPAAAAPAPAAPAVPATNRPVASPPPLATQPPPATTPATTKPETTTSTTTTSTSTAPVATTVATTVAPTTGPAHTTTYPNFTVSGVAEVYLSFVDDREIGVYSVIREPNWVYQVDKDGPRSIEVKFFNVVTEKEAEFHAEVEGGTIKVESD